MPQSATRSRVGAFRIFGVALLVLYVLDVWSSCRIGLYRLLWLCDVAVLLTAIGLLTRNALLISAQLTCFLVIHLSWDLDFVSGLTLDRFPIGCTAYMFQFHHTYVEKCLSFVNHVLIVPVCVAATLVLGVARRAWLFQTAIVLMVVALSMLLTLQGYEVNWLHSTPARDSSLSIFLVHYGAYGVLFPLVILWPTQGLLCWLIPDLRRWFWLHSADAGDSDAVAIPREVARYARWLSLAALSVMVVLTFALCRIAHQRHALDWQWLQVDQYYRSPRTTLPRPARETILEGIFAAKDRSRTIPMVRWPEATLPHVTAFDHDHGGLPTQLVAEQVPLQKIPAGPDFLVVQGRRTVPGSVVWLYVSDGGFRFEKGCDVFTSSETFELACPLDTPRHSSISVYAVGVIEVKGGEWVSRSPDYLVKRMRPPDASLD